MDVNPQAMRSERNGKTWGSVVDPRSYATSDVHSLIASGEAAHRGLVGCTAPKGPMVKVTPEGVELIAFPVLTPHTIILFFETNIGKLFRF